jgi:hypothetical protein
MMLYNGAYTGAYTGACTGAYTGAYTGAELFSIGFALACTSLQKKNGSELVLIEDTAHAHLITEKLSSFGCKFIFTSPTAFFLYNYACYTIKKSEFLILY